VTTEEAVLAELRLQTPWLRFLGLQALRPVLGSVLKTDKHKLAYQLSDGRRFSRQVSEGARVGAATVSRWWSEWLATGVCTEDHVATGRAKHLVPLSALGIDLPATVTIVASLDNSTKQDA
jgi:hypothetical protein